jgi:serine/threonine protein kinase
MQELTSEVMTLSYRAPEILLGSTKYGYTADIWSLGCVFAYMTLGYPLFEENT